MTVFLEENRMKRWALPVIVSIAIAGCGPLIPKGTVEITESFSYTYAEVIGAAVIVAAAWYVIDPLAPNWAIKDTRLDDTHYLIDMRKKRVTTGGDGEAYMLFRRQAEGVAGQVKSNGYTIVSWTEGVDSDFPIARRWARGVIEVQPTLSQSAQADSTSVREANDP